MTLWDWLQNEKVMVWLAGAAGAAAMAVTDWRSPWRFAQHVFVGTAASVAATPIFAPAISSIFTFISVDPNAHKNASAFIVGAFAIYIFEFALALKRKRARDDNQDGGAEL